MSEDKISSWNLSQAIIQQLAFLMQTSSNHFTNGNFYDSFIAGTEIVLLLEAHLSDEEKKEANRLDLAFNRLENKLRYLETREEQSGEDQFFYTPRKKVKESLGTIKRRRFYALREYRRLLQNLLDKYGFAVSRKQDNTTIS